MLKKLQNVNQLNLYYLLEVLLSIAGMFLHTTYYIYLTTTLGFSNTQAMFLDTVFFACIFLFEVPTGVLGDKFGRKFSFLTAQIILGFSFLIFFLFESYIILILGSIIFALGMAFESGAFEAWIVDQVPKDSRQSIFVSRDIIGKISIILIPIISVLIAESTSYAIPYLISFVFSFIIFIVGFLFMKENKENYEKGFDEKRGLESLLSIGFSSIKKVCSQKHLRVFLISTLLSSLAFIAIHSYSGKLIEISISSKFVGVIISISSVFSILFTLALNKFKLLDKTYLIFGFIGGITLLILGFVSNIVLLVILFILQVITLAAFEIQRQTLINNAIDNNRATMLSVFSFAGSISGVIGTLIFGILADALSINSTFSIAGILILFALVPLYFGSKVSYYK